jgi:TRAP-type transport system periplasmic protein
MNLAKSKKLLVPAIILVLILGLSVFLGSCGGTVTQTATTTATSTATTTATATTTSTATTTIKPITLVFSTHNPGSGFLRNNLIDPWFREVEKRSNGRLIIEEHWNGELVSLVDAYDAVVKGSVDMAEFFPSMLQGRFVMDDVVAFSTYYNNRPAWTLYELAKSYPMMNDPYKDTHLLIKNLGYSIGFATTQKQIKSIEGSKGIKLGPVGMWSAELMKVYGWVPVSVPPEESVSALQNGVQEGSGISMYLLWDFGWGSLMKYITVPIRTDEMETNITMNLDKWNKLPKEVQDAFNGAQEWAINYMDAAIVKNAFSSQDLALKDFGIQWYTLPDSEVNKLAEMAAPVRQAYVKSLKDAGLPSQEFVDKYLELDKKYADPQYKPK